MLANEVVMLVQESSYGTPVASPVVGTSAFYINLPDSDGFSMVEDPEFQAIPYGGGLDVEADTVADHRTVKGSLSTLLYPSQAAFLLGWALTRVNAGQTTPWAQTSEPENDLASVTCYHAIRTRSNTWIRKKYPGAKALGLTLSASRDSPKWALALDLQASKEVGNAADSSADPDATEFPLPTDAQMPRGPYLFGHSVGNFKLDGAAVTLYRSISLKVENTADPQWWESHWLSTLGVKGRKTTLDAELLLKTSPDLRALYQAVNTAQSLSLKLDNGTHSAKVDMGASCYIGKVPYGLPLGKEFTQKATFMGRYDVTAGTDLTLTTT